MKWFLSHKKNVTDLLDKFRVLHCNTARTPVNITHSWSINDGAEKVWLSCWSKFGWNLLYLTHQTRHHASNKFIIKVHVRPRQDPLWRWQKSIKIRKGTRSYRIQYTNTNNFKLCGFFYSDWAVLLMIAKALQATSSLLDQEQFHGVQRSNGP